MFTFDWNDDGKLDGMAERVRDAIEAKLTELAKALQNKVIENVSGKILQRKSGQLASSIFLDIDLAGRPMTWDVYVNPQTPKAWALEKGGKGYYDIVPVKARALHWISKDGESVFRTFVHHPPSRAFRYLGEAEDEIESIMPGEIKRAIEEAMARGG